MGSQRGRIGLMVYSTTPPEDLAAVARSAEESGFDEIWIPEDYFMIGGTASAAVCLAATEKIPVGIGVVSSMVRHPAVAAMEAATLARVFPGRVAYGVGHGVPAWVAQMGLVQKSPLRALRAVMESVDELVHGGVVDGSHGPFEFNQVKLMFPVEERMKLMTGVIGPKSLELSGELADGTVMSVVAGAKYIEFACEHIAKGAEKSGRDFAEHEIPVYAIYHVNTDSQKARSVAREALAFYLHAVGPTSMTGVYGINDELKKLLESQDLAKIASEIPDEWLDWFTITGTPEECVQKIETLHDSGATSVVLSPFPAEDAASMVEMTRQEVLPHFASGTSA